MRPLPRLIAASGLTNLADGVAVVAWAWLASLLTRDALVGRYPGNVEVVS